jgi:hypothetical protein
MTILYTVCVKEPFESWSSELEYLNNSVLNTEFHVQSGSYVENIGEWVEQQLFDTKYLNFFSEDLPDSGRLYILMRKNMLHLIKEKEINGCEFTINILPDRLKFSDLVFDPDTYNVYFQDCHYVHGRDFFFSF